MEQAAKARLQTPSTDPEYMTAAMTAQTGLRVQAEYRKLGFKGQYSFHLYKVQKDTNQSWG